MSASGPALESDAAVADPDFRRRLLVGLCAAAFTPGALAGLMISLRMSIDSPQAAVSLLFFPEIGAVIGLIVAVPVILFAGLPLLWLYLRMGWRSWPSYALGGAAIGFCAAWVEMALQDPAPADLLAVFEANTWPGDKRAGGVLIVVFLGAASASVLWAVLYTRTPVWLGVLLPLACILAVLVTA